MLEILFALIAIILALIDGSREKGERSFTLCDSARLTINESPKAHHERWCISQQ